MPLIKGNNDISNYKKYEDNFIDNFDIAIDKESKPVLIEWNRAAELSQVAHGPAFGDYTEEILSVVKREKNTRFCDFQ